MLPPEVERHVERYLTRVDRVLPRVVEGFYVVGSTAMGAFRPGRSDIDFIAVIAEDATPDLRPLERAQRRLYRRELVGALLPPPRWPLVCNGVFIRWSDLARSPLEVTPVASHTSGRFAIGAGFDVNPVIWRTLATRGIPVRGPEPGALTIHHDDAELRQWTFDNLNAYWRRWADAVRRLGWVALRSSTLQTSTAWGALGAPRLHHTIRTGEIISKEQAGEWGLETYDQRWHPLIARALAYWRGESRRGPFRFAGRQRLEAGDFVAMVVETASAEWQH